MGRAPSGKILKYTYQKLQKNGDTYVYERETRYDPKKKYNPTPANSSNRNRTSSNASTGASPRPGPAADSRADEKWQESLVGDLYGKWTPPEGAFWHGSTPPQAVVELTIAADGRVLKTRLVTPSGNARMDATIREMLKNLRSVPRPPEGGRTIRVTLIPE